MLKQIAQWKSVRKFADRPVEQEKLLAVLRAGRRAPSWKNIQPWKFIAITGETDKARLAAGFSMGGLIKKAPAVILCAGNIGAWERDHQRECLKGLLAHMGSAMADEDIEKTFLDNRIAAALAQSPASLTAKTFENMGIAYGFMILEAMNQGLGACIVGEIDNELTGVNRTEYDAIKTYFGLKDTEIITAAIVLGYPAKEAAINPRKPEEEIWQIRG